MIVSIHQPAYLPWLGYFDKIARADVFVWLDTVQFQKSSFQNRNRILTKDGPIWLTVPVQTSGCLYGTPLRSVKIANSPWRRKHRAALTMNYKSASRYAETMEGLASFYDAEWDTLDELCFKMLQHFCGHLGIENDIVRASELQAEGCKSDLILSICKSLKAKTYLSGSQGRSYLKMDDFKKSNIEVEFQDYRHPTYRQCYPGFVPNMSIVDLLMNEICPTNVMGFSQVATW